ncbi:MAG: HYExAFE family protein [Planctomycetaceae bacterium]
MVLRENHYELAFEEYLRAATIPYVAVDESRRALLSNVSLKSMDFIVYGSGSENLLIDIKGRQFPTGFSEENQNSGHKWVNWATNDDVLSLLQWEQVFGDNFSACFVFAYEVLSPRWYGELHDLFVFKERVYSFYLVPVRDFYVEMKRLSTSWDTYSLPAAVYRRLATPFRDHFQHASTSPVPLSNTSSVEFPAASA